jgi:polyisoprenoid-binding protein YceI
MALRTPEINAGTRWELDPANTTVGFSVKKFRLITVRGQFSEVRGSVELPSAALTDAVVDIEIDAASIDTEMTRRDTHLRAADFLDVQRCPTITFRSSRVEDLNDDRLRIHGCLTIRGLTREVALDATLVSRDHEQAEILAATALDRRDFGPTWNFLGLMVGDTVEVKIAIRLHATPNL